LKLKHAGVGFASSRSNAAASVGRKVVAKNGTPNFVALFLQKMDFFLFLT
jgi:hypothetical protein